MEARVRLVSAERERDLALERLNVEQGHSAEAHQRNETLLDLYVRAGDEAQRQKADADRFRKLWEQAVKPGIPVKDVTTRVERSCSLCGTGGLIYEFEGKVYCHSCLGKKHPLLS